MSPESSNPNATGDVIVPPPTPVGAGSPGATTGVGVPPPGGATQIAALPEFGGVVKATTPASFRKALVPGEGIRVVPVREVWGLQGPEVAMGIKVIVPSLLPMKRPFQRPISICPFAFRPGTKGEKGDSNRMVPPTGTPPKKHAVHGGEGGGGLSPKPTIRTGTIPEGTM